MTTQPLAFGHAHAEAYDARNARLSTLTATLHVLTGSLLSDLPANAHILCGGVGKAYETKLAPLPPQRTAGIIEAAGFTTPIPFFQALMIHGWFARRPPTGDVP